MSSVNVLDIIGEPYRSHIVQYHNRGEYGGDVGGVDVYKALQQALTQYDNIHIPAGKYFFSDQLTINRSSVYVCGEGAADQNYRGTILQFIPPSTTSVDTCAFSVKDDAGSGLDDIQISNLILKGPSSAANPSGKNHHGMLLGDMRQRNTGVFIDNVRVQHFTIGVELRDCQSSELQRMTILDCRLGLWDQSDTTIIGIRGCNFRACYNGVILESGRDKVFSSCTFEGNQEQAAVLKTGPNPHNDRQMQNVAFYDCWFESNKNDVLISTTDLANPPTNTLFMNCNGLNVVSEHGISYRTENC